MELYDLMKALHDEGCMVSISEVKDAIEVLRNVDTSDPKIVYNVLEATLGKDDVCKAALPEALRKLAKQHTKEAPPVPEHTEEIPEIHEELNTEEQPQFTNQKIEVPKDWNW